MVIIRHRLIKIIKMSLTLNSNHCFKSKIKKIHSIHLKTPVPTHSEPTHELKSFSIYLDWLFGRI